MGIRPGMEPEPVSRRRVSNQRRFGQRIHQHLILIIRTCGHVGIANTMALADAKVTRETYLPGGQFDKGADGEPNGVIREAALEWFKKQRNPESARKELKEAIVRGGEEMLRWGVTTVHTEDTYDLGYPGNFMDIYHAYQELAAEKKLPVRIYQKISLPTGRRSMNSWKDVLCALEWGMISITSAHEAVGGRNHGRPHRRNEGSVF